MDVTPYIKRIKSIIDRNMTPSGPNFDAEALLWALAEIERLEKELADRPKKSGANILSTSWGEEGF